MGLAAPAPAPCSSAPAPCSSGGEACNSGIHPVHLRRRGLQLRRPSLAALVPAPCSSGIHPVQHRRPPFAAPATTSTTTTTERIKADCRSSSTSSGFLSSGAEKVRGAKKNGAGGAWADDVSAASQSSPSPWQRRSVREKQQMER
jgi:hypothetical protein